MQVYAGIVAKIRQAFIEMYVLDIDDGDYYWGDWMFDPDYRPEDEPLSAEDAIRAMLDGETLYDRSGDSYTFNKEKNCFECEDVLEELTERVSEFDGLHRHPAKRNRPMTRREAIDWARSKESWGWLVRRSENDSWGEWQHPIEFDYSLLYLELGKDYQRARMLPDHSGIDEDTIQGFEVEV
jgi:hypothetical protein